MADDGVASYAVGRLIFVRAVLDRFGAIDAGEYRQALAALIKDFVLPHVTNDLLSRYAVTFGEVAVNASRCQVPGNVFTATGAWDYVINVQLGVGSFGPAVAAGEVIATQDFKPEALRDRHYAASLSAPRVRALVAV